MKAHREYFSTDQMAQVLGVSRSGYYAFLKQSSGEKRTVNAALLKEIQDVFEESQETYGSPRVHAELKGRGINCSRHRVARVMRKNHLQAKMYRKFRKTTRRSKHSSSQRQDLLQQNFYTSRPDTVWVADITFLWIGKKWAYLAVILDLFSRKVVGMALQEHMKTDLVLQALHQALLSRNPPAGLVHHSDRGSQYTSHGLSSVAEDHGISLSYGQSAYDNAVMESFFHTLKTELVYFKNYQSIEEATLDIFAYIFTFYNSKRRHSTLSYQTPNQMEKNYHNTKIISVLNVH